MIGINYIIGLTLTATLTHYMAYHCNEIVVSVQIGCMSDQLGHRQDILSGYIFKLIINPAISHKGTRFLSVEYFLTEQMALLHFHFSSFHIFRVCYVLYKTLTLNCLLPAA